MAHLSHCLRAGLVASGLAWSASAVAAGIEMAEYTVPSDPGIQLYVREKHPAGTQQFGAGRILLFVHGATYPAETSFDLPVGGTSMMDLLAARGWDVWLVDVRGYSRSTRPASMDRPAAEGRPVASTAEAARDVAAAVDFIQGRRGVAKINLMGWSWGTSIMGLYASTHNEKVERLVLYAPQWLSTSTVPADAPPLGAYRTVTRDAYGDAGEEPHAVLPRAGRLSRGEGPHPLDEGTRIDRKADFPLLAPLRRP